MSPASGDVTATIGERPPADPVRRRRIVHDLGPARPLHLGDYLGPVQIMRALAADPMVDLTVRLSGAAEDAALAAATLVGCGLGSAVFELAAPATGQVVDLRPTGNGSPDADLDPRPPRSDGRRRPHGVAVYDLRHPRRLMGTVPGDRRGIVHLLDTPLRVAAAIRSATTDLDPMLGYDPQLRPGVANLAVILAALTDRSPISALFGLHGINQLKRAVTEAVEHHLRTIRDQYVDLVADPETLRRLVDPLP